MKKIINILDCSEILLDMTFIRSKNTRMVN